MAGYIGANTSSVTNNQNAAERRKKFTFTANTTVLSGLNFLPEKIHIFHNGIRLVRTTDYTEAADGKSVTLVNAAQAGDEVVAVTFAQDPSSGGGTSYTDADVDAHLLTAGVTLDATNNRVGINTTTPDTTLDIESATPIIRLKDTDTGSYGEISASSGDGNLFIKADEGNATAASGIRFHVDGSHVGRWDDSGNLLVGRTNTSDSNAGVTLRPDGFMQSTRSGSLCGDMNRLSSDGDILRFQKDGTAVGTIGSYIGTYLYIGSTGGVDTHINFVNGNVRPATATGAHLDNSLDLGHSSSRWDDIYATNGTIQTSDENEKQQIASLTDAEITAAKAISKLFKTFKWNDSVTEKGDAARIHTGVIAQQVETAMSDVGLDASKYAFWCSNTWWQGDDGEPYETQDEAPEGATERNRKGIRYPELLAFISAATEQRLSSIEARLDALEGA